MTISKESVLRILKEFDALGDKKVFLKKYGFRNPRHKYVLYKGKLYPARAVWAAAHTPPLKCDYDSSRMWHDEGAFEKLGPEFEFQDIYNENDVGRVKASQSPSPVPTGNSQPDRRKYTTNGFLRDSRVRKFVAEYSQGTCEYCKEPSFLKGNDLGYVETHHIVSVGNGGEDKVENVIALCPNHHMEAHYGANKLALVSQFQKLAVNRKT